MRITQVETIPVRVPLRAGLTTKTAHGEHADSDYVILRVHTDAGLVGLGEATVAPRWSGETSPACVHVIRDYLAPVLVGQDPLNRNLLRARMDRQIKLNPFAKAGVEMALWDLAGKAHNVPVHALLGGKVRDEIPIKLVVGAFDIPQAEALAERFLNWGARSLKVKVGLDHAGDLARVRAVRNLAGPDVTLGIDANCGWSLHDARRSLVEMRDCDLIFAEQPIAPGDVRAWAELKAAGLPPLMADESVFTLQDAWNLLAWRAVDVLSVYPGKHGGIAATVEIAHLAQAANIPCAIGSNLELGIGTAAMLHVAAALRVIDSDAFPADIIGPLYHQSDLLRESLKLGPVTAKVPDGPGLGVELDENLLQRFRAP